MFIKTLMTACKFENVVNEAGLVHSFIICRDKIQRAFTAYEDTVSCDLHVLGFLSVLRLHHAAFAKLKRQIATISCY